MRKPSTFACEGEGERLTVTGRLLGELGDCEPEREARGGDQDDQAPPSQAGPAPWRRPAR